jgi:hypothetical protein
MPHTTTRIGGFFFRVGSPGGASADEIHMETTTTTTTCIYATSHCPTTGQLIHFQEIPVPPNKASKSGDASKAKSAKWVLFHHEKNLIARLL